MKNERDVDKKKNIKLCGGGVDVPVNDFFTLPFLCIIHTFVWKIKNKEQCERKHNFCKEWETF